MLALHFHVNPVKRKDGKSSVGRAAYISGTSLYDERAGQNHDWSSRDDVVYSELSAPDDAPEWVLNPIRTRRQDFWSMVEHSEKRRDAQVAKEFEFGLPCSLSDEQRVNLVKDFVKYLHSLGMIVDAAIHRPRQDGNPRNFHAHFLATTRKIEKFRFGNKFRDWHERASNMKTHREKTAEIINSHLEGAGLDERVEHRSLKDQGIDREPTIHMGPVASRLEKNGIETVRGNQQREIMERNHAQSQLAGGFQTEEKNQEKFSPDQRRTTIIRRKSRGRIHREKQEVTTPPLTREQQDASLKECLARQLASLESVLSKLKLKNEFGLEQELEPGLEQELE